MENNVKDIRFSKNYFQFDSACPSSQTFLGFYKWVEGCVQILSVTSQILFRLTQKVKVVESWSMDQKLGTTW